MTEPVWHGTSYKRSKNMTTARIATNGLNTLLAIITFVTVLGAPVQLASAAKIINVSAFGDGSPSLANARTAYNAAIAGDTILFPAAGNATWSDSLVVSKAVTMDGNGTTLTGGAKGLIGFFGLRNFTSTNLVRFTRFTFNLNDFSGGYAIYGAYINLSQLRIDHNTIHHGGPYQVEIHGANGVIDHNYFYNGAVAIILQSGEGRARQDASWSSLVPGTSDAMFVEANHFIVDTNVTGKYNEIMDLAQGGKYVIRYNSVDLTQDPELYHSGTVGAQSAFGTHGNQGVPEDYWECNTNAWRSPAVIEFYANNVAGRWLGRLNGFRGGSILCFSNIVTSVHYNPIFIFREEENVASGYDFSPSRTNWPAEDQVHNSFFWANFSNGIQMESDPSTYFTVFDNSVFIQQNRDFWLHAPQGTGGREYFIGANGASGSYPTDGTKCPSLGTMVFTSSGPNAYYPYIPYTYPHPLTQSPPKPTNLHLVK
jgi:hypothetical protein